MYLGTGAVMGLGADAVRLVAYQQTGLVVALAGTCVGARLVKSASTILFSRIVLVGLILAGVRFLIA